MKLKTIAFVSAFGAGLVIIIYKTLNTSKMTDFRTNLIKLAVQEHEKWKKGTVKETDPSIFNLLQKYWNSVGILNWSAKQMIETAWSAVFISYLFKAAGASKLFKYSASHSVYIREAIKNRKENNDNPFKGYKPHEIKLEPGDLIGYPRQSGVDYDSTGPYASHTDIVLRISNGIADTIGGNVSNSVAITKVKLTPDGKIDTSNNKNKYFVVIKTS